MFVRISYFFFLEYIYLRIRLWIRYFIYDYIDISRDLEMLYVNVYNLYNIRLMDEMGFFYYEFM